MDRLLPRLRQLLQTCAYEIHRLSEPRTVSGLKIRRYAWRGGGGEWGNRGRIPWQIFLALHECLM